MNKEEFEKFLNDNFEVEEFEIIKYRVSDYSIDVLFNFTHLELDYQDIMFPEEVYADQLADQIHYEKDTIIKHFKNEFYDETIKTKDDAKKLIEDYISKHIEGMLYNIIIDEIYDVIDELSKKPSRKTLANLLYNTIFKHSKEIYHAIHTGSEEFLNISIDMFKIEELLFYHTTYAQVDENEWNPRLALDVGLIPFEYDDEYYFALGGTGMDLSPKYEAYFTLLYNELPRNYEFSPDKQWDYYKHVVGKDIANMVEKKITLLRPKYKIMLEEKNNNDNRKNRLQK